MTKSGPGSELAQAAMDLDRELQRFEDLSAEAARIKLTSEKSLERATQALSRAAESQDRIQGLVQKLVAAVGASRERQESEASALLARAQEIAARRGQLAALLQRMSGLGRMAKEVQERLQSGRPEVDDLQARMQQVADDAAGIERDAREQEFEDMSRQAETLRQQILAAKNKLGLLRKKE